MAIVQTTDKWTATEAFINTWIADPTLYCNNCDDMYVPCCKAPRPVLIKRTKTEGSESSEDVVTSEAVVLQCKHCGAEIWQCCENPQIGNNKDHTYALIKQNKEMLKIADNEFSSNQTKTMRLGVSMPPRLFSDLGLYFQKMYNEKLFDEKKDLRAFMKRFPAFRVAEKI